MRYSEKVKRVYNIIRKNKCEKMPHDCFILDLFYAIYLPNSFRRAFVPVDLGRELTAKCYLHDT